MTPDLFLKYPYTMVIFMPRGPLTFAVFVSCQVVRTDQFSVTRHEKRADGLLGDQGLPGVFVLWELSPVMVKLAEKHR